MDLRAELEDFVVLNLRCQHQLTFTHAIGKGLFAVHIFSCLKSQNSNLGMPMIRSCDSHRIKILSVQHMPEVGVNLSLGIRMDFFKKCQSFFCTILIHITKCDNLSIGEICKPVHMRKSHPTQTNMSHPDSIRRSGFQSRKWQKLQSQRGQDRIAHEIPSVYRFDHRKGGFVGVYFLVKNFQRYFCPVFEGLE